MLACGSSENGYTVKGTSEGLDSLGYVADSLFAQAERPLTISSTPPVGSGGAPTSTGKARLDARMDSSLSAAGARSSVVGSTGSAVGGNPAGNVGNRVRTRAELNPRKEADTVRGVIVLSGNAPVRQPMLRVPGGDLVALSGMASGGFSRLEGMELSVKGVMITSRDVVVSGFLVRGKEGQPVLDGRLTESGGAWSLQLTDGSGTRRLTSVPASLREMVGSRVWVTLDKSGVPSTFGEILRR